MVAVQLGISVPDAPVRLRAFAYSSDRSVAFVAHDIVERRVRLGDDSGPGRTGRGIVDVGGRIGQRDA